MDIPRKYLGTPLVQIPPGALPSNSDVLRRIFAFNNCNMRGFKLNLIHCRFDGTTNNTVCRKEQGCIAKGQPCIYQTIKKNWDDLPCISDKCAIEKIDYIKHNYHLVCKRR